MERPSYYFMDSPGNDLESIAGQVASGCNMIFFVTGNGSITNFPFVPTIKIVTTTGRYTMLSREMDVNAGVYLDGVPMDELGRHMLDLTTDAASGQLIAGERAAHSQVPIWRNWMQTDTSKLERLQQWPVPSGRPLVEAGRQPHPDRTFNAIRTACGYASDQIGLIMPTSLCAGQIAKRIADYLNTRGIGRDRLSRFVALPHTERDADPRRGRLRRCMSAPCLAISRIPSSGWDYCWSTIDVNRQGDCRRFARWHRIAMYTNAKCIGYRSYFPAAPSSLATMSAIRRAARPSA
jgi:D-galactarate dehydratase / Altronate hydrolase, C terminus